MKKFVLFSTVFMIVVIFGFYIGLNRRSTVDTHPHPHSNGGDPHIDVVPLREQSVPSVEKKEDTTSDGVKIERVTVHTDVPEKQRDYDWRNDKVASPEVKRNDPLTDHIVQQRAKEQGTWMGDPEKMTPDERHSVIYRQLLEQFGDIPEVHTTMEYNRKWDNNISMTLDEEIEGLTAKLTIFPSDSTRKTIAYYSWLRSKGVKDRSGDFSDITAEDIAHLRSQGISVEASPPTANGKFKISISTK